MVLKIELFFLILSSNASHSMEASHLVEDVKNNSCMSRTIQCIDTWLAPLCCWAPSYSTDFCIIALEIRSAKHGVAMRPFPGDRKWCQKEFPCLAQFMWQQLSIGNYTLSNNRYQVTIVRRLVSASAMPLLLGDNYYIFKCGALVGSMKSITFSARMLFRSISNGKLWGAPFMCW